MYNNTTCTCITYVCKNITCMMYTICFGGENQNLYLHSASSIRILLMTCFECLVIRHLPHSWGMDVPCEIKGVYKYIVFAVGIDSKPANWCEVHKTVCGSLGYRDTCLS